MHISELEDGRVHVRNLGMKGFIPAHKLLTHIYSQNFQTLDFCKGSNLISPI